MGPKELAARLTAKGLQQLREYSHNGVNLYMETGVPPLFIVHHEKIEKYKNPLKAALRFIEIQERFKYENSIRYGNGGSG